MGRCPESHDKEKVIGRVQDKVILVTGGAMGMGQVHCELPVADMNAGIGETVAAGVRQRGGVGPHVQRQRALPIFRHADGGAGDEAGRWWWLGHRHPVYLRPLGAPSACAYGASKGAVRLFSMASAPYLAPLNIRVYSVHLGAIETPMIKDLLSDLADHKVLLGTTPIGRAVQHQEVSAVVLFRGLR